MAPEVPRLPAVEVRSRPPRATEVEQYSVNTIAAEDRVSGPFVAWWLMAAFGAVTERVRLGQMRTCQGHRNPAYLAKVAATCAIVSGGRIEMNIGAAGRSPSGASTATASRPAPQRLGMLGEGTPEQIVENCSKLEAAGMTYALLYFADATCGRSSIELLGREMIPALV